MSTRAAASAALALAAMTLLTAAAPLPEVVDGVAVKKLLRKLDHDEFEVRQRADETLRALGKPVLPCLREELKRTRSLEVRWRLNRMVQDMTIDERIGQLVKLLGHADVTTRKRADWSLRKAGTSVVPLLKKELRPELPAVQRQQVERIIKDLSAQVR